MYDTQLDVLSQETEDPVITTSEVTEKSPGWSSYDTYREIATTINNGAFAVLVMAVMIGWLTRRYFVEAVDSYKRLLATLEKSVNNNVKAIDKIADSQERIVDILREFKNSPYAARIVGELTNQIEELRKLDPTITTDELNNNQK